MHLKRVRAIRFVFVCLTIRFLWFACNVLLLNRWNLETRASSATKYDLTDIWPTAGFMSTTHYLIEVNICAKLFQNPNIHSQDTAQRSKEPIWPLIFMCDLGLWATDLVNTILSRLTVIPVVCKIHSSKAKLQLGQVKSPFDLWPLRTTLTSKLQT